jgi:hypothetical protein
MLEEKVLEELKEVSEKLNLNFNKNWFKVAWITKEQEVLTTYLSDCRRPTYEKYGHNIQKRLDNIKEFYESKEYQILIKEYGGQVIYKESLPKYKKLADYINNKEIKNKLIDFQSGINTTIGNSEKIAVLTETNNEEEKENLMNRILGHEWIHVLLENNNIRPENWKYNEGLVTYIDHYRTNELNNLDEFEKSTTCSHTKEYYKNAIIFRNLLIETKDKNKIQKIREFLSEDN